MRSFKTYAFVITLLSSFLTIIGVPTLVSLTVTYPSDPVFPTNSNFSQAVSDGWFIFLEPLEPGEHEIKFSASQLGGPTTAESTAVDVTYHLTIK
jgi:hypothetical protein